MAFRDKKQEQSYINNYKKENYDQIVMLLPKGKREELKQLAKNYGFRSTNELLIHSLLSTIEELENGEPLQLANIKKFE